MNWLRGVFQSKGMPLGPAGFNKPIATLFLSVCIAGCAKRIDFGMTGEIRDPSQLLKLTEEAERQVTSIKGEARLRVSSPKNRGSLNVFVAVARPSLLHLESLNFFGKPQAILVSDGLRFELLDQDAGKYYRGPATPHNLSLFMPLPIPVNNLVELMLGQAPRIRADSASLKVDSAAKSYVVTLASGELRQTLRIDPSTHRVTHSQVRGQEAYDVVFEDFQSIGPTSYPGTSILTVPSASTRLELRYREVRVSERLEMSLFELAPPSGVPIIDLDEIGNPRVSGEPIRNR